MRIRSEIADLPGDRVRGMLSGLPPAPGYRVTVKPLRYRQKPHLSAWTDFDDREIVLQVPEPFFPFGEIVPYAAKRRPGKGMRFIWLTEGVTFRTPREVLRFLYLHEFMHWYLWERLGKKSAAETACDRFALANYRRRAVREADADAALVRRVAATAWKPARAATEGRSRFAAAPSAARSGARAAAPGSDGGGTAPGPARP